MIFYLYFLIFYFLRILRIPWNKPIMSVELLILQSPPCCTTMFPGQKTKVVLRKGMVGGSLVGCRMQLNPHVSVLLNLHRSIVTLLKKKNTKQKKPYCNHKNPNYWVSAKSNTDGNNNRILTQLSFTATH